MPERYLLLEQPRGRERSIRLSLTVSKSGSGWDVKRTTLHGANMGTASEVLERGATLEAAEARFEFFTRSYLERGWYPPTCGQLEKRDLITRFVGRWPALPHVLAYDTADVALAVDGLLRSAAGMALRLRAYRGGERVMLRVGADRALVLSDASGLRRPLPQWLAPAGAALPASMLPAVFEARLHADRIALSDLVHAQRDLRALSFSDRWRMLENALSPALQTLSQACVRLDSAVAVGDLGEQVGRAMGQGYEEVVVQDPSRPYHYGESPDVRCFVAWERFG
jgi:hypothetical protein